jgi:hypothetical protein
MANIGKYFPSLDQDNGKIEGQANLKVCITHLYKNSM